MNYLESFKISWREIYINKMRAFLTMLGIIIGVFSIVTLVSSVTGTKLMVENEFKSIGSNVYVITPGNNEEMRGSPGSFTINRFKMRHVELIKSRSNYGIEVCPAFILMGTVVKYKNETRNTTTISGVMANFPEVRNWKIAEGTFFKDSDVQVARRVCVVGDTIVKDLYGGVNPIGKDITINGKRFKIIGITEKKGSTFAKDLDDTIFMPITTAWEVFGVEMIHSILVKVPNPKDVNLSVEETKRILARELDKDDFSANSMTEFLGMFNEFTNVLSVVMGCVAGISLFVGGIGIMNIMLVTVRERTREIGIRKAVGATFKDIMIQFLIQSTVIAVSGGLIGIMLAIFVIKVVSPYVPFPLKASFTSIVVAFLFATFTGIFFGTYPAVKAAKVDPIVALRYE